MDNLIRPFDGKGRWGDWIRKFEIVARSFKWEKEEDRSDYLVIFLEGDALRIVDQLPEGQRRDYKMICKRLNEAFMPSPTEAHQKLIKRTWQEGESVEALFYSLSDLWRLSLGLASQDTKEEAQLAAVTPFFLAALPPMVSTHLRMFGLGNSVDDLLKQARTLMSIYGDSAESHNTFVGAVGSRPFRGKGKGKGGRGAPTVMCFRCGDRGHTAKECWASTPVCYWCKQPGHITNKCSDKLSGKPRTEGKPSSGHQGSKNALAGKSAVSWPDLPESH